MRNADFLESILTAVILLTLGVLTLVYSPEHKGTIGAFFIIGLLYLGLGVNQFKR